MNGIKSELPPTERVTVQGRVDRTVHVDFTQGTLYPIPSGYRMSIAPDEAEVLGRSLIDQANEARK